MAGTTSRSRSRNSSRGAVRFGSSLSWKLPSQPLTLWFVDGLLAALILIFPFIMGGREAWGHRILVTLSLLLGFAWCCHRVRTGGRFRLLAVEPLLAAGLLLVWFQTIPLTPETLGKLSSEYQRLLPHWAETQIAPKGETSPAFWQTASLLPGETKHAFWILLSYGLIGLVVSQRLETERDCLLLLKMLGISGVLMAAFAVLQFATSNDKFFWFYRQPYTGTREVLKGAFTNRNHFAQFLALSIGPLLWWMLAGRGNADPVILHRKGLGPAQGNHSRFDNLVDPVMLLLICAVGGVLLSIMLSLSRGGMIAASLSLTLCLFGLWKSGRVNASLAIVMLGLGVMLIGGLLVFGQEKVEERISQLASADADRIDPASARRTLWKADLDAIQEFPLVGTGVGSHRHVYPIYMEELGQFTGVSFSHAESSYIHLATETGLAGLGLVVCGLLFVILRIGWHFVRRAETERVAALSAVLASLAGSMAHAAADFIWYVPCIVISLIMLCVAGLRLCSGFRPDQGIFMPRLGWLAAGCFCLLAASKVQPELARRVDGERLWFKTLIASFDEAKAGRDENAGMAVLADLDGAVDEDQQDGSEQAAQSSDPASEKASYGLVASQDAKDQIQRLRTKVGMLMTSLKADPNQPRASLLLADQCLELFDLMQQQGQNPYTAKDLRDIVRDQKFESPSQMHQFLKRAFGDSTRLLLLSDQLCRKALAMCPLLDEAYEMLATTSFLRDPSDADHEHLIQQTLLLGQHSPSTRFAVGKILFRDGKKDKALEQWRFAFHQKKEARLEIAAILGRQHSVDVIFDEFKPTTEELDEVLASYMKYRRQPDIEKLLHVILERTSGPAEGGEGSADRSETGAETDTAFASDSTGREQYLVLLMEAFRAGYEFRLLDRCEQLLRRAAECDPLAEPPRRALGLLLMQDLARYEDAALHFAWCYEQSPGDSKLEELLRECRRRATIEATRALRMDSVTQGPAGTKKPVKPISRRAGSAELK